MTKPIETTGLFKPNQSRQESKAQTTDNAARAIVDAEAKSRDAKTAKLRLLRLQQEAEASPAPEKKPAPRKRAAKA